jgi:Protein of unknown function (DUF3631)
MTLPPPSVCRRIRKLHAQIGSSGAGEDGEVARNKFSALLAEYQLSWNDLPAILSETEDARRDAGDAEPPEAAPSTSRAESDILGVLLAVIEEYIGVTPEERMAIALWILHAHLFDQFPITPRLVLLSPVRGCGKTTVLDLIDILNLEAYRTDNVSAASVYYQLAQRPRTVWLIDGLDLARSNVLRSVFNSGHRRGGCMRRFVGGRSRKYPTFAPLAIAAIGTLPLPLLHRGVVINMQRSAIPLKRFDRNDAALLWLRRAISAWARDARPDEDPDVPPTFRNRVADNWRVLLSIADSFGQGEAARAAAFALSADRLDEDPGVRLLTDIRTIFRARDIDRITSAVLLEALIGLDDGQWGEWRGLNEDRQPRKLTQHQLAQLLRPFRIHPKTIWPVRRRLGDKSSRGYLRFQFETAWASYCPQADTPTQSKIIALLRS